jgi:hypothetical protein
VAFTTPVGKGDACRDGTGDDEDEERKNALHGSSFEFGAMASLTRLGGSRRPTWEQALRG